MGEAREGVDGSTVAADGAGLGGSSVGLSLEVSADTESSEGSRDGGNGSQAAAAVAQELAAEEKQHEKN